ncbi:TPA: hypothetical protein WGQ07_000382 [Neisseria meningitidis]
MSYHQPYTMNGNRPAKVKGFMGLPRSPNVVMRKVRGGYQVGTMPDGYNKVTFRPDKKKRAALQDVQVFKTEKAAQAYVDKLLSGGVKEG